MGSRMLYWVLIIYTVLGAGLLLNYNLYLDKPDDYTWGEVQKVLSTLGYSGEPLVFTPGWLRNYAMDHGRGIRFKAGECLGHCPVFWIISLGDYSVPPGYVSTKSMKVGNIWVVSVVDSAEADRLRHDFLSFNPKISLESNGMIKDCVFNGVLGKECYSEDWQRIEKRLMSSGGMVKPCIFVHPRDNTKIHLAFNKVPLKEGLNLVTGIEDGLVDGTWSPIYLDVYINGDLIGKVVQGDVSGWKTTPLSTSKYSGGVSDVSLVIYSDKDIKRHFCFNAFTS
jgi:hypothetical protein